MSHYSCFVIVFAGYMYRYFIRSFSFAYSYFVWSIEEYNYLSAIGHWNLVVQAMQFFQHETFSSFKVKSQTKLTKTIQQTKIYHHYHVPVCIIDIIADMAMPRPDTQLMKQIIDQNNADESQTFNLKMLQLVFDLVDENNKEYKGNGMCKIADK